MATKHTVSKSKLGSYSLVLRTRVTLPVQCSDTKGYSIVCVIEIFAFISVAAKFLTAV